MVTEIEGLLGYLKLGFNGLQIKVPQSCNYHCVQRWLFRIHLKNGGLKKLLFIEIETSLLGLLSIALDHELGVIFD